jgi:hypothetical protein
MTAVLTLCWVIAALLVFTGCESTIDQARKISAKGELAFRQQGISVTRADREVRVVSAAVIRDPNGTAVVVVLRNTGREPLVDAPIAIDVTNTAGKSVFRNNAPGLELDLTHVPLLPPGQVVDWVNDQVLPAGTPAHVTASVGAGRRAPTHLPRIQLSGVRLTNDPVSGYAASGQVRNASTMSQVQLVLFATARRAGRIVAAGRAVIPRLAPGKSTTFHAYFLGNPNDAEISVAAPPSTLS